MKITTKIPVLMLGCMVLTACNPASEQSSMPVAGTAVAKAPTTVAYSEFNTAATIRDVMNTLVDPSADAIWNAVRFEIDAAGSREVRPETEADWQALRSHAVAIIEGGNSLMIPGRAVAPPGATTEFPAYEYLPSEVELKLQQDRQSWIGFAQGLQVAAVDILAAVEARDADQVSQYGADLDAACESCHSQYWYRAEAQ